MLRRSSLRSPTTTVRRDPRGAAGAALAIALLAFTAGCKSREDEAHGGDVARQLSQTRRLRAALLEDAGSKPLAQSERERIDGFEESVKSWEKFVCNELGGKLTGPDRKEHERVCEDFRKVVAPSAP
jgi:hypothetical protein